MRAHGVDAGEPERSNIPVKSSQYLTVDEFCDAMDVARSTFYEWRAKGQAPRCMKLPNGRIRIRRAEFERWLDSREEEAA
jgi:excisionase family DNA binding protein